ncbi:hypothetical protein LS72_007910 [Helicobacter apodemus]|uniref:Uncharacterized protein n=1 Tax=Helicobacter apodemus TaxID=135569 RepID=A0A4U8UHJ5_9HELI|nr:hypothetical protein [Helicobacter apodemus]TLE14864.1 hypothetical protein LS72_007910 [Helicobacter apodemus]
MNLFKTKTSLSFYSDWNKHFKTLVYAGVDWTINPNVANPKGRYSNIGYYGGGESKLDNLEYALGTTLVIPLNDDSCKKYYYKSITINIRLWHIIV